LNIFRIIIIAFKYNEAYVRLARNCKQPPLAAEDGPALQGWKRAGKRAKRAMAAAGQQAMMMMNIY